MSVPEGAAAGAGRALSRLLVVAAAAGCVAVLLRLHPATVWGRLHLAGWGLALVMLQPFPANWLNALGWRFCFSPDATPPPSETLFRLRVAGDGVNVLTPTGTLGGELVRAARTDGTSVTTAKFAQTVSQALFIMAGLPFLLARAAGGESAWLRPAALVVACFLAAVAAGGMYLRRRWAAAAPPAPDTAMDLARRSLVYVCAHPARFLAALALFFGGYGWYTLEAWFLCRCVGVTVGLATAVAVEALSNLVQAVFFLVPARVGTAEVGAAGIFAALGLSASAGFAFGLVRHVRELAWSAAGLLLA